MNFPPSWTETESTRKPRHSRWARKPGLLAAIVLSFAPGARGLQAQTATPTLPATAPQPAPAPVAPTAPQAEPGPQAQPGPEARGDLLMARKRYMAAIEAFRQGPQDSPVIWNKIGIAYHHLFNTAEAKKAYQRALQLNPRYSEAINNLGTVYYSEKEFPRAEKLYKRALKLSPKSGSIYRNLGTVYFAEGREKKGIDAYKKALALNPNVFDPERGERIEEQGTTRQRAMTHYALAKIFAQAGHNDRALEFLRRAVSEGFSDHNRLMRDREFEELRKTPAFEQLAAGLK